MAKEADMQLSCRQCGKEFILTMAEQEFYEMKGFNLPTRCKECRASKQVKVQPLACSQCGTELDKGTSIYCINCLQTAHFELEKENKQVKMANSAARSKLEASESQKAEFAELLRQKEQEAAGLEEKVISLTEDLDKAQQFYAASGWLQPVLNDIETRLGGLERAQSDITQKVLRTIQVMQERYDNLGVVDVIKRNIRQGIKEEA
ncbi:MAG: zinc-ribbon domain-containing protein [Chloroflexi bacterium]|nr:zinc-ribbon domain-containing protein [Chloroflexota bacterium]